MRVKNLYGSFLFQKSQHINDKMFCEDIWQWDKNWTHAFQKTFNVK